MIYWIILKEPNLNLYNILFCRYDLVPLPVWWSFPIIPYPVSKSVKGPPKNSVIIAAMYQETFKQ